MSGYSNSKIVWVSVYESEAVGRDKIILLKIKNRCRHFFLYRLDLVEASRKMAAGLPESATSHFCRKGLIFKGYIKFELCNYTSLTRLVEVTHEAQNYL